MNQLTEHEQKAKEWLKQYGILSEPFLQRKLKISHIEAKRIIKLLIPNTLRTT